MLPILLSLLASSSIHPSIDDSCIVLRLRICLIPCIIFEDIGAKEDYYYYYYKFVSLPFPVCVCVRVCARSCVCVFVCVCV